MEWGFSPPQWNNVTDCAIPKKAQLLQVEKMWNICLLHAPFNMNNKFLSSRFMAKNESLHTLADEQDGSRKDR